MVVLRVKRKAVINNFINGKVRFQLVRDLINLAMFVAAIHNVCLKFSVLTTDRLQHVECIAKLIEPGQLFCLESYLGSVPHELMQFCMWLLLSRMSLPALL